MDPFSEVCLSNVVIATLLGAVACVTLRLGRPALAHAVYLLALIKLVTPPLASITLWTEQILLPALVLAETMVETNTVVPTDARVGVAAVPFWSWSVSITSLWLFGACCSLGLSAWRISRFHAWAKGLRGASSAVQVEVGEFARRLGVNSIPRALVTEEAVSPMLCPTPTGPMLIFPAQLLGSLDSASRHAMIVHELAHLRRMDWVVRFVEIVVVAVWWWLPVVYWLRRGLRESEELCCDAWVTSELPGHEREYAEALVATADLVAVSSRRTPVHAHGMSPVRELKGRLKMMMTNRTQRRIEWRGRVAVLFLAAVALPLAGTVGQEVVRQDPKPTESPEMKALREVRRLIMNFESAKVSKVVNTLAKIGGLNIVVSPEAGIRIVKDLRLKNVSYAEALDQVCKQTDLVWSHKHGIIQILVPTDFVHVLGAVAKPGRRKFGKDGLTVLGVVAQSDVAKGADLSKVTVIRPDAKNPLCTVMDVKTMIVTGNTTYNFILKNGDIVFIPGTRENKALEAIRQAALEFSKARAAKTTKPLVDKVKVEQGDIVSCVIDPTLLQAGAENLSMLSLPQRIGADGTIFVPYVGNLRVVDLSRVKAEALLIEKLQVLFAVQITLTLRVSSDR